MKNRRSDKEILTILLDNIDKLDKGLCSLAWQLERDKIISIEEHEVFLDILETEFYDEIDYITMDYIWAIGVKQPRIDWLKEMIEAS